MFLKGKEKRIIVTQKNEAHEDFQNFSLLFSQLTSLIQVNNFPNLAQMANFSVNQYTSNFFTEISFHEILFQLLNPSIDNQIISLSLSILTNLTTFPDYVLFLFRNNLLDVIQPLLTDRNLWEPLAILFSKLSFYNDDDPNEYQNVGNAVIMCFFTTAFRWIVIEPEKQSSIFTISLIDFFVNVFTHPESLIPMEYIVSINDLCFNYIEKMTDQTNPQLLVKIFSLLTCFIVNHSVVIDIQLAAFSAWRMHAFFPQYESTSLHFLLIAFLKIQNILNPKEKQKDETSEKTQLFTYDDEREPKKDPKKLEEDEEDEIAEKEYQTALKKYADPNTIGHNFVSLHPRFIEFIDFGALTEIFQNNDPHLILEICCIFAVLTRQSSFYVQAIFAKFPLVEFLKYCFKNLTFLNKISSLTIVQNCFLIGGPEIQKLLITNAELDYGIFDLLSKLNDEATVVPILKLRLVYFSDCSDKQFLLAYKNAFSESHAIDFLMDMIQSTNENIAIQCDEYLEFLEKISEES